MRVPRSPSRPPVARAALIALGLLLPSLLLVADVARSASMPEAVTPRGPGSLAGVVSDAATGKAVEGVQVTVRGTAHGAITKSDGRYTIPAVPRGTYTVVARRIGYRGVEMEGVRVVDDSTCTVDFRLSAAATQLRTQVITSEGPPLVERGSTASSVAVTAPAIAGDFSSGLSGVQASSANGGTGGGLGGQGGDASGRKATRAEALTRRDQAGAVHPGYRHQREPGNTENYAHVEDNPFLAAGGNPLSTFSIDVDRASYANVRRYLSAGTRPPADAVRIEELVNYFRYDYAGPSGAHPLRIHTDMAPAPWKPAHRLLRVGLQGRKLDMRHAPPNNLVFLVDVSGSMSPQNKLPLLQRALHLLVDELREQDQVAMVVYAGSAGLVLAPTSGEENQKLHAAIDALQAGGSTAGGAGIRLAYDVAKQHFLPKGNNRVILATDGDFNVGVSSNAELVRLVEDKRRDGTFLTVLGFGMGNLKDDRLEQLADKGNGNYAYIDNLLEAKKVLVTEMGGTLMTIAKDVKLQVEFNPARVAAYRLIGYENRMLRAEDFNDDTKDAGELGAGHTVTALYEIVPVGVESDVRVGGVDSLRYRRPATSARPARDAGDELAFVKVRYKEPDGAASRLLEHPVADRVRAPSTDLTFASAVAAFGMLLRESPHRGAATWAQVAELAAAGRGADPEGYRAEFIGLVDGMRRMQISERE